ncbi:beta strand repeat-containing protein, partial [Candidatus Margulisiibacteriota bacterium]
MTDAAEGDEIVFEIELANTEYATSEYGEGLVTNEANGNHWFRIKVESLLPTIEVNNVYIRGLTQTFEAANSLGPSIEVRSTTGVDEFGLHISGDNCTIEGLVINGFAQTQRAAIVITGDSNMVRGCYLGTTATGAAAYANFYGVVVSGGSNNIIGGTTASARNIISGNLGVGLVLYLTVTNSNEVLGNYIGLDRDGDTDLGNGNRGVSISNGAAYNQIGDGTAGGRNIISGNGARGVYIDGAGTDYNRVLGNFIGTDVNGTADLGNDSEGVCIYGGAKYNLIGSSEGAGRNVISGNANDGIEIDGSGTNSNEVLGNFIGTDVNGTADLGNTYYGIFIDTSAAYTEIGPYNIIANNGSGPYTDGIHVAASSTYTHITQNTMEANAGLGISLEAGANNDIPYPVIGFARRRPTDGSTVVTGTATPDATIEIFKTEDTPDEKDDQGEGKVYLATVTAESDGSWSGTVSGLAVDDEVTATASLFDGGNGYTSEFAINETVIKSTVVTNCDDDGAGSLRAVLASAEAGDVITFDITTTEAGYSTGATDGGLVTNEAGSNQWFRIVPGSELPTISVDNVYIRGLTQTREATNTLGPSIEVRGIAGSWSGLVITGDYCTVEGLAVNGFNNSSAYGIDLGGDYNQVLGCYIGTTATGEAEYPNEYGVYLRSGSDYNKIGNGASSGKNVISGNDQAAVFLTGCDSNEVMGNYIGLSASGALELENQIGVQLISNDNYNKIGDGTEGGRNVISGNSGNGIAIRGSSTSNEVMGNYIGTDINALSAFPNDRGVYLDSSSNYNRIGNATSGGRNIISGNGDGVYMTGSSYNEIHGNYIGMDVTGEAEIPNTSNGIEIISSSLYNKVGTGSEEGRNIISGNSGYGIYMNIGVNSTEVYGNYIGLNAGGDTAWPN